VSEVEDLIGQIVSVGGAVHPDVAPKGAAHGLVVVGVSDALAGEAKNALVRIAKYFAKHPTHPALERSRAVLWSRTQVLLEGRWHAAGAPAFGEDANRSAAIDALDELWVANRRGERLAEFPGAIKRYRAAMLAYFEATAPTTTATP
jgi:hypothetical protein